MNKYISEIINKKIESLLMEAADRLAFLKASFPMVPEEDFNKIIAADPTSRIVDGKIIKAGNYSQWILQRYKNVKNSIGDSGIGVFMEDLYKISDSLIVYDKIKHKLEGKLRDINSIKNLNALQQIVKPYEEEQKELSDKIERSNSLRILHEDENYIVMQPLTKEASIKNFHHPITDWCTADSRDQYNRFYAYNDMGPLYVIKNVKTNELYQFHFPTEQYMDSDDRPINFLDFIKNNPTVANVLFEEISKNVSSESLNDKKNQKTLNTLIDLNFDLFCTKFSDFIDTFIANINCDSSFYIAYKLFLKNRINFNCPNLKLEKDNIIYTCDTSDLIDIVFDSGTRKGVESILNGEDFNLDDYVNWYDASIKDIIDSAWFNSEALLKLKTSMESESDEDITIDINKVEEILLENEELYPETCKILTMAYQMAYGDAVIKRMRDHIETIIDDWFKYESVIEITSESISIRQPLKVFLGSVNEIIEEDLRKNDDDFISLSIANFFLYFTENNSDRENGIHTVDFSRAIDSASYTSKEFNDCVMSV